MTKFTDKQGGEWEFVFTWARLVRLKDETSYDLAERVVETNGLVLEELAVAAHPGLLMQIFASLLGPQMAKKDISTNDFFDLFDGDTLEKASKALAEETVNFFPRLRMRRGVMMEAIAATFTLQDATMEELKSAIESRKLSGSSPASPVSTPVPLPSASSSGPAKEGHAPNGSAQRFSPVGSATS